MRRITFEELIIYHEIALQAGGVKGIKNESLLYSAINNPFNTFFGEDLYPTDELKIAMTTYSIINNHGFEDANKRTGMIVFQTLLEECDIELDATNDDYIELAQKIENSYDKYDIVNWINLHRLNR